MARGLVERAAQRDGKAIEAVLEAADALCRGDAQVRAANGGAGLVALSPDMTFQAFGEPR